MRLTDSMMTLLTLGVGGALPIAGGWAERRWRRQDDSEARSQAREEALADHRLARVEAACEAILDAMGRVLHVCYTSSFASVPKWIAPKESASVERVMIETADEIDDIVGAILRGEPCPPEAEWFERRVAHYKAERDRRP